MCWQCYTPPWKYLPDAVLIGDPVHDYEVVIEWEGRWVVNSRADWMFAGEALPGDVDAEGIPYFIKEGAQHVMA